MVTTTALKEIVETWLAEKKHRSKKLLSDETGVNYGTIRNVVDEKPVNAETALRILLPILPIEKVHSFIAEYYPDISPYTKALLDAKLQVVIAEGFSYKHNVAALEVQFGDVNETILKEKLGSDADSIISDLIEAGIIVRSDGHLKQRFKEIWYPSQAIASERTKIFLNNLNIKTPGNKIYSFAKSLNAEGVKSLYSALDRFEVEVAKIQANPELNGDIKVGSAALMTIL